MLAVALLSALAAPAQAAIRITEVAPYASGNTGAYAADWFELTNTGASAVNISGWKVDDNSNSFSAAVALRGITSIAAGQSVIFLESNASGTNDASINAGFLSAWFGASAPASLLIGNYGGSGVGLGTSGDAVNIFDASGAVITRVDFGSSTTGVTFNNAAGLTNVTISTLSVVGVNGAVLSANGQEIGSPGSIAAVPEPQTNVMAVLALGLLGALTLRKKTD
jgi:hypothetical protein